jgi:tetratricopeptide (TPR) repeat protein
MIKIILLCFTLAVLFISAEAQVTGNSAYDNAYRNYTAGNFEDAIRYYTEYLGSNTTSDKAFFERGMCYESIRRFDDALRDYNTAINLKPFYSLYYISRGYVYIKSNIPENALSDFTYAIQHDPSNPEAYWGRVNAYLDLDKYDFALRDITSAINLKPDNALYYYIRAIIYTKLNDTAKFYDDVERIMNNYPSSFFSSYKSQTVVLILDNIANNIAKLTYEIESAPDNYLLYFRRGFNYYVYRKFSLAIEDFSNAVKLSTDTNSRLILLSIKLVDNCKVFSNQ